MVTKVATGEVDEPTEPNTSKDKATQALGRKGGAASWLWWTPAPRTRPIEFIIREKVVCD
jgi:hypothetical protein